METRNIENYKSKNVEELKKELQNMKNALIFGKIGLFFSLAANINTTPKFIQDIKNYIANGSNLSLEEEIFSILSILSFMLVVHTYGTANRHKGAIETLIDIKEEESEVVHTKSL